MSANRYLLSILRREAVNTGANSPVRGVMNALRPEIVQWAGGNLQSFVPSGSFMKGTANQSGTDIDLFISLSPKTPDALKEIYKKLYCRMDELGYFPVMQNVSVRVHVRGYKVDLVPGKRQDSRTNDHSLYRRKADTWTKTNVAKHVAQVRRARRLSETRVIKLWRDQNGLDFPSFYLELTVIHALKGGIVGNLTNNVGVVLEYLRDKFVSARVVDPANTNNIISDDLTVAERTRIQWQAATALNGTWVDLVK